MNFKKTITKVRNARIFYSFTFINIYLEILLVYCSADKVYKAKNYVHFRTKYPAIVLIIRQKLCSVGGISKTSAI